MESVLGPLLFNIFLREVFLSWKIDIVSHAYDNKYNVSANIIDQLIDSREQAANTLFKPFTDLFKGNGESAIYFSVLATLFVLKLEVLRLKKWLEDTISIFCIYTKMQVLKKWTCKSSTICYEWFFQVAIKLLSSHMDLSQPRKW